MIINYVGLESYKARYTLQLTDWNTAVFEAMRQEYRVVPGQSLSDSQEIVTGQVLDAHGRSYYALSQMMWLIKELREGHITNKDVIFFEDMFHPGVESLPYIFCQTPKEFRPRVFMRCLAQTIDPDDFVHSTGMFPWMRKYEEMVCNFVDGILVASEEMAAHLHIAGMQHVPIYVTGLPFGKKEVQSRVASVKPLSQRKKRVAFAARWDQEKQPDFFMRVAAEFPKRYPRHMHTEFAVFAGGKLRSNRPALLLSLKEYPIQVYENLEKNEYYALLADSQVLFNCALQDWVSNTISEADALGTLVCYPAYRSFPEATCNNPNVMYVPWSVGDACRLLAQQLDDIENDQLSKYRTGAISSYQNGTILRTIDVFYGDETSRRNGTEYRRKVAVPKFF